MASNGDLSVLAVSVGNTRSRLAVCHGDGMESVTAPANAGPGPLADAVVEAAEGLAAAERAAVVVASVNKDLSDAMIAQASARLARPIYRVGADLPAPIVHSLGESHTTGEDRLLNAAAAFDAARQAVAVIDAGTAITVDFVDGEGTFQGGAIAPGARMMLRALHEQTAQLPQVDLAWPDDEEPFAKTTEQAMLNGVCYGARGMVRMITERFAERYGAYPLVVATGGDAELLFRGDEFVERIVPNLTLRGVWLAARAAMAPDDAPSARLTP